MIEANRVFDMAPGQIVKLEDIPYLNYKYLENRFVSTLTFYDQDWKMWAQTIDEGHLVEIKAWPAEAFYWAKEAVADNDFAFAFLNFMAQSANSMNVSREFLAVQDDYFNLAASFEKIHLIHSVGSSHDGSSRLVSTEIEYLLTVCRSIFDLIQEIISKIWSDIKPLDATVKKKKLPETFSGMTRYSDKPMTAEEIALKRQVPAPLAECYARHSGVFQLIRAFRDSIIHGGHKMQIIYRGEREFLIEKNLGPFRNLDIWEPAEVEENEIVPLVPALSMVVHSTIVACEDFASVLSQIVRFPPHTVPGMVMFMRGYHNNRLALAIADAETRIRRGRTLMGSIVGAAAT